MLTYLKQLLCRHRYNEIRKEPLGYQTEKDKFSNCCYSIYAIHKECSWCEKKTIEIRKRIYKVYFNKQIKNRLKNEQKNSR